MKEIVIRRKDEGHIEIIDGELTTGLLTVGEALETVISFIHRPRLAEWPFYPMKTQEQWEAPRRVRRVAE